MDDLSATLLPNSSYLDQLPAIANTLINRSARWRACSTFSSRVGIQSAILYQRMYIWKSLRECLQLFWLKYTKRAVKLQRISTKRWKLCLMIICRNGITPLNHRLHNSGFYLIRIPKCTYKGKVLAI